MSQIGGAELYDEMPYPELSYAFTHPGRILAIASLLGLDTPPIESVRVLELGCAAGQNLVSMAYGLPTATFVGVDYGGDQVQRATAVAADLGLRNATFHHLDITSAAAADLGQFDLVIAHGMYTWVPLDVRDRILELCDLLLAPTGLAFVSYNTYPGWSMLMSLRGMMLYSARRSTTAADRVARSRAILDFLGEHVPNQNESIYAAFVNAYRQEAPQSVLGGVWADASLLHDELEPHNSPVWFHEMATHAARHGLAYLAETPLSDAMNHDLPPAAVQAAQAMANDAIEFEQHLDFLRNRMFRRSILCREAAAPNRSLKPAAVRALTASSSAVEVEPDAEHPERTRFTWGKGPSYGSSHELTVAALRHLVAVSPQPVPYHELLHMAAATLGEPPTDRDEALLTANLLTCFTYDSDMVELRADRPTFASAAGERPVGSPVARHLAQSAALVTSLRHDRVQLDDDQRALLLLLDGTRDRDALVAAGAVGATLDEDLAWLARAALLVS
jgi:SAM-dependent methyltransferase